MVFSWFQVDSLWFLVMILHDSRSVFMVFHSSRLVFHGSRSVFKAFHGSRLDFHGLMVENMLPLAKRDGLGGQHHHRCDYFLKPSGSIILRCF